MQTFYLGKPQYGIRTGIISAVYPHLGLYTIIDFYGSYVTGVALSHAGHSVFGSEAIRVFPIGCEVIYLYLPGLRLGVILGVLPERVRFPGSYKQEELVPGSSAGYLADPFIQFVEKEFSKYGLLQRYRGTYIDALPGDVVQISRTGTALFSSPFLVGLKANEFCGVWANYLDSLLRIAGWNFQEWTSGYEKSVHVNWNLVWEYEGHGATIFEQLGYRRAFEPNNYSFWEPQRGHDKYKQRLGPLEIAFDPNGKLLEIPGDTTERLEEGEEPELPPPEEQEIPEVRIGGKLDKYRLPVHTRQSWGGILAPGGVNFVFAQPDSIEGYRTELEGNEEAAGESIKPRPLIQHGITHTGIWYVKSTNAILLCKFPWVSAPLRIVDADEKAGEIKYGKVKQAEKYLYRRDLNTRNKDFTTVRCTSLYDIQNYITNWEGKLGFYVFSDKFEFITEQDQIGTNFHQYRGEKPVLKRQRRSASFIYMDPYGDIVLENGAGAAIELIGDTIRISAPGGVYIDGGYQIKMFSNHIVQLAENEHNTICGKQYTVFMVRKPNLNDGEGNRRVLTGLKIWVDKSNKGRVLVPRDAIAQIYNLNSMNIVANDVANLANSDASNRLKEEDFSLYGDDLNPLASATYPVQRWAWFYQQFIGGTFDQSKLVAPERFSVKPSTFKLEDGSKEPKPSSDENKLLEKEFNDEFKRETVYPLLYKKYGGNDYSV